MSRVGSYLCAAAIYAVLCCGCASLLGKKSESHIDQTASSDTPRFSSPHGNIPPQPVRQSPPKRQVARDSQQPVDYRNSGPPQFTSVPRVDLRNQHVPPGFRDREVASRGFREPRPFPPQQSGGNAQDRQGPRSATQLATYVSAQRPPTNYLPQGPPSSEQKQAKAMFRQWYDKGELDRDEMRKLEWVVMTSPHLAQHFLSLNKEAKSVDLKPAGNSDSEKKPPLPASKSAPNPKPESPPNPKPESPPKKEPAPKKETPAVAKSAVATSVVESPANEKPEVSPLPKTPEAPKPQAALAVKQPKPPVHWKVHIADALASLERSLSEPKEEDQSNDQSAQEEMKRVQQRISLRLLQLLAGKKNDALRPIDGLQPQQQEYWKHQLHGLSIQLDENGTPLDDHRWRLALRSFQDALRHLAAGSSLEVRNLTFCRQVDSYGRYLEFESNEFRPGQEVLLYAEIDNFTVEESAKGLRNRTSSELPHLLRTRAANRGARVACGKGSVPQSAPRLFRSLSIISSSNNRAGSISFDPHGGGCQRQQVRPRRHRFLGGKARFREIVRVTPCLDAP